MHLGHLALAVILAACGGKQPGAAPPPPPDAAPELVMTEETARETADGLLEVWTTMAAIVEARAGDCPAMAADLGALFDQAEPLFEITRAAQEDPASSRVLGAEFDRHAQAVTPLVDRIVAGITACREDPAMLEVMQRMPVI